MSLNERENGYSDDEMDFDETEFDEDYFDRTYRPLSNLPTPPPSSWDASDACSPGALLEDGELLGSVLLGQFHLSLCSSSPFLCFPLFLSLCSLMVFCCSFVSLSLSLPLPLSLRPRSQLSNANTSAEQAPPSTL